MKPFRIVAPIVVLGAALGIGKTLIATKPEAQRRAPPPSVLTVDARFLTATNYPVKVPSQGVVRARTRSSLIAQAPGEIVQVAPAFRDGGFFEEGELLAQIDPRDYETAVTVAEAALKQAEASYAIEVAQAAQARADWERLGLADEPSPLTLREPQLAEAEASVASARARVDEARRNLERTSILAPYAGRLLSQQVDVGQFVGAGATLATIYAVDLAEIRLPLSDAEYGFVGMPERYRQDQRENVGFVGPTVTLSGVVGRETERWPGRLVRTEGAIDSSSRQHFVIAQVDDPYGISDANRLPLKVGLFVEAVIDGVTLPEVFVVPRSAIRNGNEALIIDEENRLQSRSVEVIWGTESEVVIESGLQEGELLCLTPLPFAANGAPVAPDIEGQGLRRLGGGDGGMRPNEGGGPGGARRPGGGSGPGGPNRGGPGANGGRPEGPRGAGAGRPAN